MIQTPGISQFFFGCRPLGPVGSAIASRRRRRDRGRSAGGPGLTEIATRGSPPRQGDVTGSP